MTELAVTSTVSSKQERKEAKRRRKEEKEAKRLEKEAKHRRKEDKRRRKRQRDSSSGGNVVKNEEDEDAHTTTTTGRQRKRHRSDEEASRDTALRRKVLAMTVSLLPHALADVRGGVRERIASLLLKYDEGVGGVLLAFSDVRYHNTPGAAVGTIHDESPYVHYQVEVDALVFAPNAGAHLTGAVNECFPSHVGMLVRSFFNAMIPSHVLEADGYRFDSQSQRWMRQDDDTVIGIDSLVPFRVEKVHACGGVVSLEGKPVLLSSPDS